jgi:hypothetical protein
MCLSYVFPSGFGSVLYYCVPFLYYHPVYSFCIIFLYAFSALSSNVTFLYYPFIFSFCIVLACTVSVLSSNVNFLYYYPVYPFCIILPYFFSALSCRVPLLYYVPVYRFLIILPCTLYHINLLYNSALYYFPTYCVCVHSAMHVWASSYGKAAEHVAEVFHLRPRLRMCGSMLPLSCMPSWPPWRQVFTLPSRVPHFPPIANSLI